LLGCHADTTAADRADQWRGVSLTTGEVRGQAWVLAEPSTTLPTGFTAVQTILVARSVDAGWIPTFACIAGVVVETGGDLSHGSIILREIGLPAITNVRGVTQVIQTGDELVLRAGAGVVERTNQLIG
jgi:rifampicin phosphotransferase